jgi:hypothetical protein
VSDPQIVLVVVVVLVLDFSRNKQRLLPLLLAEAPLPSNVP